jgi:hypothetical protein
MQPEVAAGETTTFPSTSSARTDALRRALRRSPVPPSTERRTSRHEDAERRPERDGPRGSFFDRGESHRRRPDGELNARALVLRDPALSKGRKPAIASALVAHSATSSSGWLSRGRPLAVSRRQASHLRNEESHCFVI